MWRYLVLHSLWFSMLFLVNFTGTRKSRNFVLFLIFAFALAAARWAPMDPFAWLYYFASSLLVFYGAAQFRQWAAGQSAVLDRELREMLRRLERRREQLGTSARRVEVLSQRAEEISELYDKIKEMSQSLDILETFLAFAEMVANSFRFNLVKLALFNEESFPFQSPEQIYEMRRSDFTPLFDRGVFLKDRKKAKGELFPADRKIFEEVFRTLKPLAVTETNRESLARFGPDFAPFIAIPIFIQKKIFAILVLSGVEAADTALLTLLTERFGSEIQRVKLYEKVQMLAITDGLTGVYVRRHLFERLEGEMGRCKKFGFKLSFLMIDLDHFKQFNDEYGHLVGDVVLRETAETVQKSIREVDLVARYGGEEFGVLLIETDESAAFLVAERIRRSIAEKTVKAYGESLRVTASIGCATSGDTLSEASLIVDAADSALYQAKRQGRDRVCVSGLSVKTPK